MSSPSSAITATASGRRWPASSPALRTTTPSPAIDRSRPSAICDLAELCTQRNRTRGRSISMPAMMRHDAVPWTSHHDSRTRFTVRTHFRHRWHNWSPDARSQGMLGEERQMKFRLAASALAIATLIAACGGASTPGPSASANACFPVEGQCPEEAQALTASGATFPAVIYTKWVDEYYKATGVQVNYQAIGSGGGIKAITEK